MNLDEKPIEMLMGRSPGGGQGFRDGWCMPHGTSEESRGDGHPAVDDMLDWLRESTWHVSRLTPGTPKATPSNRACRPAVVMLGPHRGERWFHGPTLHAALEEAVRAVSAAENEHQQSDDRQHKDNGHQHG